MNQGNVGRFRSDDGVWQDGGLLFTSPRTDQWAAIFLKFQSQTWHTDDTHGPPDPGPARRSAVQRGPVPMTRPGHPAHHRTA